MEKKFNFVSLVEDCDEEAFDGLKEDWGGLYEVTYDGSDIVRVIFGEMTVEEFKTAIAARGDELDDYELEEIETLALGEETELARGRSGGYEVKRIA